MTSLGRHEEEKKCGTMLLHPATASSWITYHSFRYVALDDPCHIELPEATSPDLHHVHFCRAYNAHHLDS